MANASGDRRGGRGDAVEQLQRDPGQGVDRAGRRTFAADLDGDDGVVARRRRHGLGNRLGGRLDRAGVGLRRGGGRLGGRRSCRRPSAARPRTASRRRSRRAARPSRRPPGPTRRRRSRTGAVGASRLPASGCATTTAFASTTFHTMSARAAASTVTARSRSTFPPSPSTLMTSGRCSVGAGSMVMLPIWARSAAWTDQTLGPSPSPAARCTSARGSPALAMAPPSAAVGVNVGFSLASVRPRAARSAKTPPKARSNVPGEETVCGSCGPLARSWGSAATSAPAGSTATPPSTAAVWAAPTLPMSRRASSPTVSRPAELPSPTEPPTSRPMGVSSSCAGGVGVTV